MVKQLSSVDEVIAELGGREAVAELTRRNGRSSAIPMWRHREHFPANTHPFIKAALHARGADAPNSLWKLPEVEQAS